jgi:hypothetical protein
VAGRVRRVPARGVRRHLAAGYLVPGTPTLTKRYFPEWLLAAFDKEPPVAADKSAAEPAARNPETLLSEAGVVEPCADPGHLCLDNEFRAAWDDRTAALADADARRAALAGHVDGWEGFGERTKSSVPGGLRAFLDACPECDGAVTLGTDTVESCCRTHEVLAVGCEDCGARLLEVPADGAGNDGGRPEQADTGDDGGRSEQTDADDDRLERADSTP